MMYVSTSDGKKRTKRSSNLRIESISYTSFFSLPFCGLLITQDFWSGDNSTLAMLWEFL